MAKLYAGINGAFSGKVGTVNGYLLNGMPVMRANPKPRTGKLSDKQILQHAKFALMTKFLKPLVSFTNKTFETDSPWVTGFNKAYSYNVKNATTAVQSELAIDYNMVLVGRGDLPGTKAPMVVSSAPGELKFNWADNSGSGMARDTDVAFIAVYNDELNVWIYDLNVASRSATTCHFQVSEFIGRVVRAYIGFTSKDGKNASDSQYLGKVQV